MFCSSFVVMMSSLPSPVRSADGHGILVLARAQDDWRPEGAVAVAQQHVDGAGVAVADDQVELAVAVEVGHRQRGRAAAGGEGLLGLEGAVAVAQEHAHVVAAVVGGDDIGNAVAVQVRHLHLVRSLTHRISLRRPEIAVALVQEDADVVVCGNWT